MPRSFTTLKDIFSTLFSRRPDVHVDGVEVTQAIQYYDASRHLADPSQQGADNSVRLVVNKPAYVRVYVRSGLRSFGPASGTLEIQRRGRFGPYQTVATLAPQPPGELMALTDPPYELERGEQRQFPSPTIPGSLNFAVPASMMFGSLMFRATVSEGRTSGGLFGRGPSDTRDVHVDVDLRQTLRLRAIMVGYSGPKSSTDPSPLFLSPPNYPADLLETAKLTLLMYPVQSAADYSSAGWVTCDRPLDDAPGCSPNWDALVAKLVAQKVADGNRSDVIYYGLLPLHIPFRAPHDGVGCERSEMSAGRVDGDSRPNWPTWGGNVMAHQVGHECGLLHAPGVDNFGAVDPNYPAYPPYDPIGVPKGSIGEYGLIIGSNVWVLLPRAKDIMGSVGFGGDTWLSLYHYGRLLENPKLAPVYTGGLTAAQAGLGLKYGQDAGPKPKPMISIIGLMRSERDLEVTSVMRLETRAAPFSARASGLTAELRDERGAAIAQAPLHMLTSRGDEGGCRCHADGVGPNRFPCVVQALLPDGGRGARLVIGDTERDLWVCAAREKGPRIARFDASLDDNRLVVRWKVEAEAVVAEVWLQWSADLGETWNALATGLAGDHAVFDGSDLPAGTVTLRLLASDGFDTEVSGHVSVQLPDRPPAVHILTPGDGEVLRPGGTLRLWGAATVNGRPAGGAGEARWLLDGEPVAEGLDALVRTPRAGEHILELVVTADRLEGRVSRRFVTAESATAS